MGPLLTVCGPPVSSHAPLQALPPSRTLLPGTDRPRESQGTAEVWGGEGEATGDPSNHRADSAAPSHAPVPQPSSGKSELYLLERVLTCNVELLTAHTNLNIA